MRKTKKRIISVFTAVLVLFSLTVPAMAQSPINTTGFTTNWYGAPVIIGPFTALEHFWEYQGAGWSSEYMQYSITGLAPGYENLTDLVIPQKMPGKENYPNDYFIDEIYPNAFLNHMNIQSVEFNFTSTIMMQNINQISYDAFKGCTNLSRVVFNNSLCPSIWSGAFDDIAPGATAYVKTGEIGSGENMYNPNLYPFIGDSPLKLVRAVDNENFILDNINYYTVNGKDDEVMVEGVNWEIPADSIASLAIPGTVISPNTQIQYKVTSIDAEVLCGLPNLTSLTIGANVNGIGPGAIANNPSLQTVIFEGSTAPDFYSFTNAFNNIASGAVAYVPAGRIGTQPGMYNPNSYPFIHGFPLQLTAE